jgi:predicted amidohydrolase
MWVDPWGQVVACQPQEAACVVAELDMQVLRERRKQLPAVNPGAA